MNVGDLVASSRPLYVGSGIGIITAMIEDHYFDIRIFFPLKNKSILAPARHFRKVQDD